MQKRRGCGRSASAAATPTASARCAAFEAGLLDGAGRRRLVALRREHLADVDGVEAVAQAAELAAHLDLAALGDQALALLAAEPAQHVAHALARTGAREARAVG